MVQAASIMVKAYELVNIFFHIFVQKHRWLSTKLSPVVAEISFKFIEWCENFSIFQQKSKVYQSGSNHRWCSVKKVFLEISQNLQKNTCDFKETEASCLRPATLFKKGLWHRCFPVNFVKFLKTPFLTEHLWWLLLSIKSCHTS